MCFSSGSINKRVFGRLAISSRLIFKFRSREESEIEMKSQQSSERKLIAAISADRTCRSHLIRVFIGEIANDFQIQEEEIRTPIVLRQDVPF